MKAAPPYSPAMYGNLQMLPSPMADPAMAMMTANLPPKVSLSVAIFVVRFPFFRIVEIITIGDPEDIGVQRNEKKITIRNQIKLRILK